MSKKAQSLAFSKCTPKTFSLLRNTQVTVMSNLTKFFEHEWVRLRRGKCVIYPHRAILSLVGNPLILGADCCDVLMHFATKAQSGWFLKRNHVGTAQRIHQHKWKLSYTRPHKCAEWHLQLYVSNSRLKWHCLYTFQRHVLLAETDYYFKIIIISSIKTWHSVFDYDKVAAERNHVLLWWKTVIH